MTSRHGRRIGISMKQSLCLDFALEFVLGLATFLFKMCKLKIEHVMLLRTGMESRRCINCGVSLLPFCDQLQL